MMTRRLLAVLASLAFTTGSLAGTSAPAQAADAGTVTVSYNPSAMNYSVTPSSLTVAAGDTFTLANTMNNSQTSYVSLQNGTGAVTLDQEPCTSSSACQVVDAGGSATGTFTVVTPGTVTVWRYLGSGSPTQIGTLTLGTAISAPGPTDPALVYPTAFLNANGGTCTGTLQFTKYAGQNGTITLPTADACTRSGYTLDFWSSTEDGEASSSPSRTRFVPGETVPIGDESFTLYAQWRPNGVEISYDANVATADDCIAGGTNTMTRTSIVVVQHPGTKYLQPGDGSLAGTAPCTPNGVTLAGWRIAADSTSGQVYPVGAPVTDLFPGTSVDSTRIRLAAVWVVAYQVTASPTALTLAPGTSASVTVAAQRNRAPVPSASVAVSASGDVVLGAGGTTAIVTTGADGTAVVTVTATISGSGGTITVAYGDAVTSVPVTVRAAEGKSILILDGYRNGERIDVTGTTTGLAPGTKLSPWIRFPGQTGFSQGTAIITVGDDGTFSWGRKTGKRTAVQIRDADGSLKSNTVIIEAR